MTLDEVVTILEGEVTATVVLVVVDGVELFVVTGADEEGGGGGTGAGVGVGGRGEFLFKKSSLFWIIETISGVQYLITKLIQVSVLILSRGTFILTSA